MLSVTMELSRDPLHQTVTLVTPSEPVFIPVTTIDAFNDESISTTINYAFQIGACFILLLVTLIMTPPAKLSRPSCILHITGLIICIIRTSFLLAFYLSPLNHFYQFWSHDYSSVPALYFRNTVAGNCFSLLLAVVVEMALMHQAWTMVSLWPTLIKLSLVVLSAIISLLAVGWRFAFTIVQSKSDLMLTPARDMAWLVHATVIVNCISICWYCALFNVKLVIHLLSNRGILPSYGSLSPMEILVITNGVLMVVPVIFAGLEWGHFPNFEAAALTLASVVIILPLGTLAAQQMTRGGSLAYLSNSSGSGNGSGRGSGNGSGRGSRSEKAAKMFISRETSTAGATPKLSSFCTMHGSSAPKGACISSRCDIADSRSQRLDHFDMELRHIDSTSGLADYVRVDTDLEQKETRV